MESAYFSQNFSAHTQNRMPLQLKRQRGWINLAWAFPQISFESGMSGYEAIVLTTTFILS